jgi:hypothetical protein
VQPTWRIAGTKARSDITTPYQTSPTNSLYEADKGPVKKNVTVLAAPSGAGPGAAGRDVPWRPPAAVAPRVCRGMRVHGCVHRPREALRRAADPTKQDVTRRAPHQRLAATTLPAALGPALGRSPGVPGGAPSTRPLRGLLGMVGHFQPTAPNRPQAVARGDRRQQPETPPAAGARQHVQGECPLQQLSPLPGAVTASSFTGRRARRVFAWCHARR